MSNECGQFQIDPVAKAGGFWKQMIEEFKLNAAMIWLDLRLKIQHVSPSTILLHPFFHPCRYQNV